MDLKLLFKTLLKPNCLIRDTASQTLKNLKFRRKFGHFRYAVSRIRQINFKSVLNKRFSSVPPLIKPPTKKEFQSKTFFSQIFLSESVNFSKLEKKNFDTWSSKGI